MNKDNTHTLLTIDDFSKNDYKKVVNGLYIHKSITKPRTTYFLLYDI